ncbi:Phosphotransferase enzyme family protein [Legionella rubrilucens]|uniref:Phosphotransferase enzyme family protein n=1 Tax=Legionella rubrilucens TaxID=458 RepID=A0A0W0XM84_9GAMM|nr:aminoglycoside phosphotransferase family protein [Legionella rubrilucens]KTD45805.1 Phosphotransferase enzyme family protein [Legionella rubrilucens]
MIFKANWEAAGQSAVLSNAVIDAMVSEALPDRKSCCWERLSGGCANNSILIREASEPVYVLRIYLRDPEAAFREQQLASRLAPQLPVPQSRFVGIQSGYRFALIDYCRGISLREVLLGNDKQHGDSLLYQAGVLLGQIQTHQFKSAGFFDRELRIVKPENPTIAAFVDRQLTHPTALALLSTVQRQRISAYFNHFAAFLPDEHPAHLVHGDYDPANLLVDKRDGAWHITAVLDWEFAFAGSPLWDVANMLRYAHAMPASWASSFLDGLQATGRLPNQWQVTVHLLNLASLLDCLCRTDPIIQPHRLQDILTLVDTLLGQLSLEA